MLSQPINSLGWWENLLLGGYKNIWNQWIQSFLNISQKKKTTSFLKSITVIYTVKRLKTKCWMIICRCIVLFKIHTNSFGLFRKTKYQKPLNRYPNYLNLTLKSLISRMLNCCLSSEKRNSTSRIWKWQSCRKNSTRICKMNAHQSRVCRTNTITNWNLHPGFQDTNISCRNAKKTITAFSISRIINFLLMVRSSMQKGKRLGSIILKLLQTSCSLSQK